MRGEEPSISENDGIINAVGLNREVGFGFVFVSCVRAGKANRCMRVRDQCMSTLGLTMVRCAPPGVVVGTAFFLLRVVLSIFPHGSLLHVGVLIRFALWVRCTLFFS